VRKSIDWSIGFAVQVGYLFADTDRPIMGDHDPSGHDIERDIHHRVEAASGKTFRMIRLAIHHDIEMFKLNNPSTGFWYPITSSACTVSTRGPEGGLRKDPLLNS
jgi:hypothetical protein